MEEPKYSDNLPREIPPELEVKGPICCHLNDDGSKCNEFAEIEHFIFEDEKPTWCVVTFCSEHAKLRGISLEETQNYN